MKEKRCIRCLNLKPISRFAVRTEYKDKKEHRRGVCMDCFNKRVRKQRASYKKQVFDHYGWECACCGESIPEFLTIDHINNDGYLDRMKRGWKRKLTSKDLYYMIIKEGFPDRFQTLCQNCNLGKLVNKGVCPHKTHGKNYR